MKTYPGINVIIHKSRWSTWITDQAKMLICILVTELQITTLASTYMLYYYLLCSHNFRKRNKSIKRAQEKK